MNENSSEKIALVLSKKGYECASIRLDLRININEINIGEILKLVSDDPETILSIPKWCEINEQELFLSDIKDDEYVFYIRRKI